MPDNIEQHLIVESGKIAGEIRNRILHTSPYTALPKTEAWPDEQGPVIKSLYYERSLPLQAVANGDGSFSYKPAAWTNVNDSSDTYSDTTGLDNGDVTPSATGSCVPTADKIKFGQSFRTARLQHYALESPDLCVNDLRSAVQRRSQLSQMLRVLTENTAYVTIERTRDEYIRIAENKLVLDVSRSNGLGHLAASSGYVVDSNGWVVDTNAGTTPCLSILTQGALDRIYMRMNREGASISPLDRVDGAPIYGIIVSPETSDNILRADNAVREDFRQLNKSNELLGPLGVNRSYKGWAHIIDLFPPRHTYTEGSDPTTDGAWVRVYPYYAIAAGKGFKLELNPAYDAATHEDSVAWHADVATNMVPKTITNPGAGITYDPINYMGDWSWKNIPDRVLNPDGNIGYFRGVFMCGSRPEFPQYGWVIRHLRPKFVAANATQA